MASEIAERLRATEHYEGSEAVRQAADALAFIEEALGVIHLDELPERYRERIESAWEHARWGRPSRVRLS